MDWFDLIERFQDAIATSIAAILGFGGIILIIRSNANLAFRERQQIRRQEHQSLVAALHGELDVMRFRLETRLGALEDSQEPEELVAPLEAGPHPVFDACLSKLGLLEKKTISELVYAYFHLDRLPDQFKLAFGDQAIIRDPYVMVSIQHKEHYKAVIKTTLENILSALEALDCESKVG
jgi:hypothetical protein